jgi:hypothetical protein
MTCHICTEGVTKGVVTNCTKCHRLNLGRDDSTREQAESKKKCNCKGNCKEKKVMKTKIYLKKTRSFKSLCWNMRSKLCYFWATQKNCPSECEKNKMYERITEKEYNEIKARNESGGEKIHYDTIGFFCKTRCPYKDYVMVSSNSCQQCSYFVKDCETDSYIICSKNNNTGKR